MIELQQVHVRFNAGTVNENHALRDITLRLEAGEFVSVIGSNGAGKSTLLNTIAGTIPVDQGRVHIGEADVTRLPEHKRCSGCARVFQDPLTGTCGPLTIEENLALAVDRGRHRTMRRALTKTRRADFRRALEPLGMGLESRLVDRMDRLSGGQRQALSLLMATLAPSEVLLLDEHTAALDPVMAELVVNLTDRIVREKGLTALMVTHSMAQALAYGDRLIMMHRGRIALDLDAQERRRLSVEDLIAEFSRQVGGALDDDKLLL